MHIRTTSLATAGLTAASLLAGLGTATVTHADVAGTGLTVQGNTFQVGQTYNVVLPLYVPCQSQALQLTDTANGATILIAEPNSAIPLPAGKSCSDPNPSTTISWTPQSSGTHVLELGTYDPTAPLSPVWNADHGSVTVQVSGPGSTDPRACASVGNMCLTVHGTPEAGCTLTATVTGIPTALTPASILQSLSGGGSSAETVEIDDNGQPTGSPQTVSGTTATMQWKPAAGNHSLDVWGNLSWPESLSDAGHDPGLPSAIDYARHTDLWFQIAPAGTQPCA